MGKRIIFATGNEGKMREIRMILADLGIPVVSLKDAGISADIEENGKSFAENAVIKAKTIMEQTGEIVLADDSGLAIDYLDGAPGIYSARFMGEDTSYDIKNNALIGKLAGVPDEQRTARFVCAIACAFPDGTILESSGTMEGRIGYEISGANGFGYLPQYGCTSAQITPEQKNELSHRGKALRAMKEKLADLI
jgi:XTP/dITP diphosphohydrolase